MKILIDPNLSVFIKDLTDKQCADLLRCIFEYPERDCDLGIWQFIKRKIEEDVRKYQEKCDRMLANRKKSTMISEQISGVDVVVAKRTKHNKNTMKGSVSSNAAKPVENFVEKPLEFYIDENFSFDVVTIAKKQFAEFTACYPMSVIMRAEETLKLKRKGQWLPIDQIVSWIVQENDFYNQRKGS